MKKLLSLTVGLFLVFMVTGSASAIPYQSQYGGGGFMSSGDSDTWTFSFIIPGGFDPDLQDVTSASVSLYFSDPAGDDYSGEDMRFVMGSIDEIWEVDTGVMSYYLTDPDLLVLSDTGMIEATLSATRGDFIFESATLNGEGTNPIPEPGTMVLFGIGLLGLAGITRKKTN
ncbi:MAG: PEP-CTERM sorting domain-containing protein [Deltaproteobacteria bacterium]|jgi:hypothetical protein|nr:PEP-CTERM sorting domain-containing protein [Deltaproteobacteria bacterium]